MFCRNCGERNEEMAKYCQGCGAKLETKAPKKSRAAAIVISVLLTAGAGYGVQQYLTKEDNAELPIMRETLAEKETLKNNKKEIIKAAQKKVYTIVTDNGIGSGFLFTKNGMVVTNAHVVAGYTNVLVRNSDGIEEPGRVVGISDVEDIAVIEVDGYKGQEPLPSEMALTDVGSEVIALGSPNGFENSASIGYLTGVDRDIVFDFEYEGIYQIDAQIAPGSSGGPLIDAETGKVIGINSLLYTDGNAFGFSIPLYSVHESLMDWVNDPMSAASVASVFGVYESYDYFDWLEEYDYEDEPFYDTESNVETEIFEEEEYVLETDENIYQHETSTEEAEYVEYFSEEETSVEEYAEEEVIEETEAPMDSEEEQEDETIVYLDEGAISLFVSNYRANYELALANEDFSYVSGMLLDDSEIYSGISNYIEEISGQGMLFEFIDQTILSVELLDQSALVHTYESFDFMNAAGEWNFEERNKTYTVVVDEFGDYWISDIVND